VLMDAEHRRRYLYNVKTHQESRCSVNFIAALSVNFQKYKSPLLLTLFYAGIAKPFQQLTVILVRLSLQQ
jgi:hypothetical protein